MRRAVAAGSATLLSLLFTGAYAADSIAAARLLGGRVPANVVPPPALAALIPARSARPAPIAPTAERVLVSALGRGPIDQSLYNLWYVARTDRADTPPRVLAADAALLRRLGWRSTPALQNLLYRDMMGERVDAMIDTADALFRRQQLVGPAIAIIETYEQFPDGRRMVLRRLLAGAPWRDPLLMDGSNNRTPAFQTGRLETLRALVRAGRPLKRADVESFVDALVAGGRIADAAQLWSLYAGPARAGSVLRDADFAAARRLADTGGNPVPFDWTLASGIGYSTIPSATQGLSLDWDGRGAPLFASQRIASGATPPRTLLVESDEAKLGDTLRFALTCDGREREFLPAGNAGRVQRFVLEPGADCAAPTFAVLGRPDIGSRSVDLSLRRLVLR